MLGKVDASQVSWTFPCATEKKDPFVALGTPSVTLKDFTEMVAGFRTRNIAQNTDYSWKIISITCKSSNAKWGNIFMRVPLLNFERGPRVPLLNFEGGPGVPLLNIERVPGLTFKLWWGSWVPRFQFLGSWSHFYTIPFQHRYFPVNIAKFLKTSFL